MHEDKGINYSDIYERYWYEHQVAADRTSDVEVIAKYVVDVCGISNVVDIGSGQGGLVKEFLRLGLDAIGMDVSSEVVARCNQENPDRFIQGSLLNLPFPDEAFSTVVSVNGLEYLTPSDIPVALSEIYRITQRNVFLQVSITRENDWILTTENREWWERRCLDAGFRKHSAYYTVNRYETLNADGVRIYILLEKIPATVLSTYPLSVLEAERGLHMDMLRDVGERSDAHVVRYHWASSFVRHRDMVLDAACGLGYGSHVIAELSRAESVVGIDGSAWAVSYAEEHYGGDASRVKFSDGMLPEVLAGFPDSFFDIIISFETLEHVEEPVQLLAEFSRLLKPGGRVVVSIPNDWSDETGIDPNPHHLHVYDWMRLKSELEKFFIIENAVAQTATRCKVRSKGNTWQQRQRMLLGVGLGCNAPIDCEWWLMTAMKSPVGICKEYQEKPFAHTASSGHPSLRYEEYYKNPWIMHSIVNAEYRLQSAEALQRLVHDVLACSPVGSNDYAAALCVQAYRCLDRQDINLRRSVIQDIERCLEVIGSDPMGLRWRVSLLFVKAKILQFIGCLEESKATFAECARTDISEFGVHLATKITESAYLAGKIAYALGDRKEALLHWSDGVKYGRFLKNVSFEEILINPGYPNLFNHGDGVREYALAWDNISRCANGVHLLHDDRELNYPMLDNCHQTEYSGVTGDLIRVRQDVAERTTELVQCRTVLVERTAELDQSRSELERNSRDLIERTAELVQVRAELVERTGELIRVRAELVERTVELVQVRAELVERTEELVQTRAVLVERTLILERACQELEDRMMR